MRFRFRIIPRTVFCRPYLTDEVRPLRYNLFDVHNSSETAPYPRVSAKGGTRVNEICKIRRSQFVHYTPINSDAMNQTRAMCNPDLFVLRPSRVLIIPLIIYTINNNLFP